MDEKRKFFRIKNKGEICAQFGAHELKVIDVSASSVAVIADVDLPQVGIIKLKINLFSMNLNYELLRKTETNAMVLIFNQEEQIEKLLPVLKNLRKTQSTLS